MKSRGARRAFRPAAAGAVTVPEPATIHASAVLVGARAALIRGPSGAGKSRLVLALLEAGGGAALPFVRLVADDRVHVESVHGRLLARPVPALAGLIEVRGLGLRRLPYESVALVGLVIDLGEAASERLPPDSARKTLVSGVNLSRLAVASGRDPLPPVLAVLRTAEA